MNRILCVYFSKVGFLRSGICALVLTFLLWVPAVSGADLVTYSLCDVRVMYLFEDPQTIDWPVLYYLNDNFGCRIDLVTLRSHTRYHKVVGQIPDQELYLHRYYLSEDDTLSMDSLYGDLFCERCPDIVIIGKSSGNQLCRDFANQLKALLPSEDLLFNILKVYEIVDDRDDSLDTDGMLMVNVRELANRYRKRMEREIPQLFHWYRFKDITIGNLASYQRVRNNLTSQVVNSNFIAGIDPFRLVSFIRELFPEGPMRKTYLKQAQRFISGFNAASGKSGGRRVDLIVKGYRDLIDMSPPAKYFEESELQSHFRSYLKCVLAKAEKAALAAVGISWHGNICLRDSPHGPKVKFTASLSVDGPREVELSSVVFYPYWDTTVVPLDTTSHIIFPHQSHVREYLVDIDRSFLETENPDSLIFSVTLTYGTIPLTLTQALAVREMPKLKVRLEPDFCFVQPIAKIDIDRVVSSMVWNLVITKPNEYSGRVHLKLTTPRGVFAGAYRADIKLDQGNSREMIRIPFSLSNLFEMGIHYPTVLLEIDDQVVAADTGRIRIARCHIDDRRSIAYLPDSTGLLEDILRMTDASFHPLTDRSLMTADLSAYDVIVIGSGAAASYPSLRNARDRFETYLRWGGSIVVFGQDYDWPEGVLPFALTPSIEQLGQGDIANPIPKARLLTKPDNISVTELLTGFGHDRRVAAAVVSPSEKVLETPSGASLLSISRLGDGQVIYCGFPLLQMISELDLQAIHLFANMLNY